MSTFPTRVSLGIVLFFSSGHGASTIAHEFSIAADRLRVKITFANEQLRFVGKTQFLVHPLAEGPHVRTHGTLVVSEFISTLDQRPEPSVPPGCHPSHGQAKPCSG